MGRVEGRGIWFTALEAQADLIEGVKVGGAADYLDFGLDANINLFV
jgi:hypothetical protein